MRQGMPFPIELFALSAYHCGVRQAPLSSAPSFWLEARAELALKMHGQDSRVPCPWNGMSPLQSALATRLEGRRYKEVQQRGGKCAEADFSLPSKGGARAA